MTHPKWKTNDEFPGSISLPYGIKTSHTWHELGQILRIINDYSVYSFAELGCHVGGMASLLLPRSKYHSFRYIGFELEDTHIDDVVREQCVIHIGDIFKNIKEAWSLAKSGKTFLYCDNGNKSREMYEFAQYLEMGDIIACHDYYDGQDVVGLENFGRTDECGCVPEVSKSDVLFLFDSPNFQKLPQYLLDGTRIIGFLRL